MLGNKGISVIICCYNSKDRLPNTIRHIANQVVENIAWELIIVDNNSSDGTSQYALEEVEKYDSLINRTIIISEKNLGLSNARMCGVAASQYEYIIFCDDDNWLDQNYLRIAFETLEDNHKIAAAGGQSTAISDVPFPDWWDDYKGGYAIGKQAEQTGDITSRMYLWGSGLAFRKSLYNRAFYNFPSLLSDRKGNELSAGGDTEICMRFIMMDYILYYNENLKFNHYIDPKRSNWDYRKQLFEGFNKANEVIFKYKEYITLKKDKTPKLLRLLKLTAKLVINKLFIKDTWKSSIYKREFFYLTGISLSFDNDIKKIRKFGRKNTY